MVQGKIGGTTAEKAFRMAFGTGDGGGLIAAADDGGHVF